MITNSIKHDTCHETRLNSRELKHDKHNWKQLHENLSTRKLYLQKFNFQINLPIKTII
jgi:hypothetical protein